MESHSPKSLLDLKSASPHDRSPSPTPNYVLVSPKPTTVIQIDSSPDPIPYDFKSSDPVFGSQATKPKSATKSTSSFGARGSNSTRPVSANGKKFTPRFSGKRKKSTSRGSNPSPTMRDLKSEHFILVDEVNEFCRRMMNAGKGDIMKQAIVAEEPALFKLLSMYDVVASRAKGADPPSVKSGVKSAGVKPAGVRSAGVKAPVKRLRYTQSMSEGAGTSGGDSKENPCTVD